MKKELESLQALNKEMPSAMIEEQIAHTRNELMDCQNQRVKESQGAVKEISLPAEVLTTKLIVLLSASCYDLLQPALDFMKCHAMESINQNIVALDNLVLDLKALILHAQRTTSLGAKSFTQILQAITPERLSKVLLLTMAAFRLLEAEAIKIERNNQFMFETLKIEYEVAMRDMITEKQKDLSHYLPELHSYSKQRVEASQIKQKVVEYRNAFKNIF